MRKSSLSFSILLALFSCGNAPTESALTHKEELTTLGSKENITATISRTHLPYQLKPATKADFNKAATQQSLGFSMHPADARKVNGVMTLKINGKWQQLPAFKDTLLHTDDSEQQEFRYLGQHQQLNMYLLAGMYFEDYKTFLIDKATGEIAAETWTEPDLSPDLKYLANPSSPTLMDQVPNGVQVWKVVEKGSRKVVEKHFQIEQQEWEPFELRWESPSSLIIKMMPMAAYESLEAQPSEKDFSYLRLTLL